MTDSHFQTRLKANSSHIGNRCPISHKVFQVGDEAIICQQSGDAFAAEHWTEIVSISDGRCRSCGEPIANVSSGLSYSTKVVRPPKLEGRKTNSSGCIVVTAGISLLIVGLIIGVVLGGNLNFISLAPTSVPTTLSTPTTENISTPIPTTKNTSTPIPNDSITTQSATIQAEATNTARIALASAEATTVTAEAMATSDASQSATSTAAYARTATAEVRMTSTSYARVTATARARATNIARSTQEARMTVTAEAGATSVAAQSATLSAQATAATIYARTATAEVRMTSTSYARVTATARARATNIARSTQEAAVIPTSTPPPAPQNVCDKTPSGEFVNVWQQYKDRLGCPIQENPIGNHQTILVEQPFSKGHMFYFESGPIKFIVVKYGTGGNGTRGTWQLYDDNWDGRNDNHCVEAQDIEPRIVRGFNLIWCTYPEIRDPLGWPLDVEKDLNLELSQGFESGFIIRDSDGYTNRLVYIFFNDGAYERVSY